jgi:hypothetical protein
MDYKYQWEEGTIDMTKIKSCETFMLPANDITSKIHHVYEMHTKDISGDRCWISYLSSFDKEGNQLIMETFNRCKFMIQDMSSFTDMFIVEKKNYGI